MFTLNCNGRPMAIDEPLVMGVVNITDDSFYAGSRYAAGKAAVDAALQMLSDGAAIIDVGAQSTRPQSRLQPAAHELETVIPFIAALTAAKPDAVISIDTFYADVAYRAVKAGASMVNDVSAGNMDADMIAAVAELKVPFIAMHMKGTPQTMQQLSHYNHLPAEIMDYFIEVIEKCTAAGVNDVVLDPGFGFAKTTAQNFELLRGLSSFKMLGKPLLAGVSRKSMIYKTLSVSPEEALNGTTVLHTMALLNGADILRVHDVKPAVECIKLVSAYNRTSDRKLHDFLF